MVLSAATALNLLILGGLDCANRHTVNFNPRVECRIQWCKIKNRI